ncbi:hypothetical protein [Salmonella phage vB_SenM-S16]|uniref:Uncharacterized protein n=1 Tax=Salmonella phage S16 TaxID=1087482 RepID=M1EAS3_BPS16|nr:hypothetical protein I133_gp033 [Salmonella phage vB_SenM-S16]AEO97162.1 hypothetical protein [Salmonella phage vB_SenM-S16]WDR21898.1 hypothetical protein PJM34_0230 [Salmonella phage vB_SenM_UTK0003]
MKIGKKYELVPELINDFIGLSPLNNAEMVDIIHENGGWFEVKSIELFDNQYFVTEIVCANGECFCDDGLGDCYFELYDNEFYCFREYEEPVLDDECKDTDGVTKIHCVVTKQNVDEIIELLQKTFK